MSENLACLRKSKSAKNLLSSQEFEKVDSLNTSLDAGKIQSVCIPEDESHSEKRIKRRRGETYWEMIINIATNLRFNLEMWTEAFWPCNDSKKKKAYLLGKEYEPEKLDDLKRMRTAFSHILWFSYRKNFPMLNCKSHPDSESFISDTGWGCMIRVCQMMFAECLKRHCLSNKACCNEELPCLQNEKLNYEVASWFLDSELDSTVAPYSIQTLSARLQDTFKLKPGIWLKPSSVLFALQEIHQDFGHAVAPGLQMEIYIESTLYVTQALKKVTCLDTSSDNSFDKAFEKDFEVIEMKKSEKEEQDEEDKQESCENIDDDLGSDADVEKEEKIENYSMDQLYLENAREIEKLMSHKWKDSLIVFMLAKIGLDKPNPEYIPFIKDLLSYPESVGMIGGRPGLAYYIVGYIEDKLVYLDPHFVQESLQSKKLLKENMHTYYASSIKHIGFTDIDTSVTLGFFIKDEKSFKAFVDRFRTSCASSESFLCIELDEPRENTTDVESVCETYEDNQKAKDEDEFERI